MSKTPVVGIIDTGTSNIKSVIYACQSSNMDIKIIDSKFNIDNYQGLIVPGIGSFNVVMNNLKSKKLDINILEYLNKSKPAFFICVGMQILFSTSEEFGESNGLNVFNGKVKKIPEGKENNNRRVPLIGWNSINILNKTNIFNDIEDKSNFYFTHSYYADPENKNIISSTANYDGFRYCSSITKDNIFATQFHPEKSSITGLKMYNNFRNFCLS